MAPNGTSGGGTDASDAGADASDAGADASDAETGASDEGPDASDTETGASDQGPDASVADCPAREYYFEVGPGEWRGRFHFAVTDWRAFLRAPVGVVDRLLVAVMALVVGLLGPATIRSSVEAHPERGRAGVATNDIRVTKFGVALYTLGEEYRLAGNCRDVTVVVEERFGPVPGLLENEKDHPAEVVTGPRTNYTVPLLGVEWDGRVEPVEGGDRIEGRFECDWAVVEEGLERVG